MTIQSQDALLVPMGLKALVMPDITCNGTQGWDRRTLNYANLNKYQSPIPATFGSEGDPTIGNPPDAGVHLYWTLPRALARALSQQDLETVKANGGSFDDLSSSGFPFIPNRWLVVHIVQGNTTQAAAWVINSDEVDNDNGQAPLC